MRTLNWTDLEKAKSTHGCDADPLSGASKLSPSLPLNAPETSHFTP